MSKSPKQLPNLTEKSPKQLPNLTKKSPKQLPNLTKKSSTFLIISLVYILSFRDGQKKK
jgi:hypothetical protein